jgi:hypothetical protein
MAMPAPSTKVVSRSRTVAAPSWTKLSRGMAIRALVEARLLGKRLLTLEADIAVLPTDSRAAAGGETVGRGSARGDSARGDSARGDSARGDSARGDSARGVSVGDGHSGTLLMQPRAAGAPATLNGSPGDGLTRAARSLEHAAAELRSAREAMP